MYYPSYVLNIRSILFRLIQFMFYISKWWLLASRVNLDHTNESFYALYMSIHIDYDIYEMIQCGFLEFYWKGCMIIITECEATSYKKYYGYC